MKKRSNTGKLHLFLESPDNKGKFRPLALPSGIKTDIKSLSARDIHGVSVNLLCELRSGTYNFLLTKNNSFNVEIDELTTVSIVTDASPVLDGPDGFSILKDLELKFSKPLILSNVLQTLSVLPSLFSDNDVALLKELFTDSQVSAFASNLIGKAKSTTEKFTRGFTGSSINYDGISKSFTKLKDTLGLKAQNIKNQFKSANLPLVHLEKVTGKARKKGDNWVLEFAFSGKIYHQGKLIKSFSNIILPHALIPSVHASLEKLLSEQPLESASVMGGTTDFFAIAKEFGKSLDGISGNFTATSQLPDMGFNASFHDGADVEGSVKSNDFINITGVISGNNSSDKLIFEVSDLRFHSGQETLNSSVKVSVISDNSEESPIETILNSFERGNPGMDSSTSIEITVNESSKISRLSADFKYSHPLVKGEMLLSTVLKNISVNGYAKIFSPKGSTEFSIDDAFFNWIATYAVIGGQRSTDGVTSFIPEISQSILDGNLSVSNTTNLTLNLNSKFDVKLETEKSIEGLPELNIDPGIIKTVFEGNIDLALRLKSEQKENMTVLDLYSSKAVLSINFLETSLQNRRLSVSPSKIEIDILEGLLDSSGLGSSTFNIIWNLDKSPVLYSDDNSLDIFVSQLLSGDLRFHINSSGGISVSGNDEGLYDAAFFNAIFNPGKHPEKLINIIESGESWEKISGSLSFFNSELSKKLEKFKDFIIRVNSILKHKNIKNPSDAIPAEVLSDILCEIICVKPDSPWREEILNVVWGIIKGNGLNIKTMKSVLRNQFDLDEYEFELHRALKWLSLVLSPVDLKGSSEPIKRCLPFRLKGEYTEVLKGIPTAESIYSYLENNNFDQFISEEIAGISHYLERHVLTYILENHGNLFKSDDLLHMHYLLDMKNRIYKVSENFGGFTYLPQGFSISFFLDAVCSKLPPKYTGKLGSMISNSTAGPKEIAILLRSTLSSPLSQRIIQINFAQIINVLKESPAFLITQTLDELSEGSPRVLAFVLYGLCNFNQNLLREPVDMVSFLSSRLEISIPSMKDYLAGGRFAGESYIEKLFQVSELVMEKFAPYTAIKAHLNVRSTDTDSDKLISFRDNENSLLKLIESAESLTSKCTFSPREKKRQQDAVKSWNKVFTSVGSIIEKNPAFLNSELFKKLFSRSHEALMIQSIHHNVVSGDDNVEQWVKKRSSRAGTLHEQIIESLYHSTDDRKFLASDKFIRLKMDIPDDNYNFSIISCMGVVTEGSMGRELEDAYARLKKRRGIDVLRADTQTARSLNFNAWKIIDEIKKVTKPYGIIGYSQGCANALKAESILNGGTPHMQKLASGLVSRNLLFSAINGSAHGTGGNIKFMQAMAEVDKFLKFYQAVFSGKAVEFFLDNLGAFLDSRLLIHLMGGIESLSQSGVVELAREGQFKMNCPTSTIRGVVDEDYVPEALFFLSNILTKQLGSMTHDTQVEVSDAIGFFNNIDSAANDILKSEYIPSMIQRCHHWSPLLYATEFITTELDKKRMIYDMPKDRHVFPWIDNLIRFGLIKTA
ncbi:MAG: hypothetical protein JXR95_00465 [Deltaproteobacteria bacterium]|nr:hypothetical protein [Deltaproteobacteria bacterium]